MTIHTRETSPRLSATEKRGLEWHWVEVAGQRSQEARKALIESLVARDPQAVSQASLAQGARDAARRNALLATPWLTYEELAYMRADASVASTRTAVARLVGKHRLLTVPVPGGRTGIPAFQLDDAGRPRDELAGVLRPLLSAGVPPWQAWTWLTGPTSLLSGGVPIELAENPETRARAERAAERFAAGASTADAGG